MVIESDWASRVESQHPAGEALRFEAERRESTLWRAPPMRGPYGVVGVIVAIIVIFILLRLLGVL